MWWKALLLFYAFSFIFRTDTSLEQDLGRHLKLGEIIWQSKEVPQTNLFSYTHPNFPFINHHWGFQVIVYLINLISGPIGLLIMKFSLLLGSIFLVLKTLPTNYQLLSTALGFLFLHLIRERIELRPEIFSFFFTALTIYILEKGKTRLLWLLPLIQLLWTNIHIYFPVGLMIQGIFLISKRSKQMFIVLVTSTLITLINPNFIQGALYPFKVFGNYGYTIVENQTIFFLEGLGFSDPNFIFVKAAWAIIVLALLSLLISKKTSLKELGLLGLGVGFSLQNVRSIPYLFFISLAPLISILSRLNLSLPKSAKSALLSALILLISIESYFYLSGDYYRQADERYLVGLSMGERGKGAMDFVLENNLEEPIFNNFDIGSYIIYNLFSAKRFQDSAAKSGEKLESSAGAYRSYPKIKVFVDGRPEAYPADFFQQTYIPVQYDYNKFKELDSQINFKTIIYAHTDQTPWGQNFIKAVNADPDWKLRFVDDLIMVLSKGGEELDISKLNPDSFGFKSHLQHVYLGIFLFNIGEEEKALEFFKVAQRINPDGPMTNRVLFNKEVFTPWW